MTAALRGPLRKKQSHRWQRQVDDWYVEPRWVSRRLFQLEVFPGGVWDPACGGLNIITEAQESGLETFASDKVERAPGVLKMDFFAFDVAQKPNIVSNPPFALAEDFVQHALDMDPYKVAMLLPSNWVQGDKRSRWLQQTPLKTVYFITPRPSMPPGDALQAGVKAGSGTTDYAWFVWERGHRYAPTVSWLRKDV